MDTSKDKKNKLANTRKRFKELQQLKQKKNVTENEITESTSNQQTPIDSLTSSTHSSINNEVLRENTLQESCPTDQLPDYFTNRTVQQPAAFFDNFSTNYSKENVYSQDNLNPSTNSMFTNYFSTPTSPRDLDNIISNVASDPCLDNSSINENQQSGYESQSTENYALFPSENGNNHYMTDIHNITNPHQDSIAEDDPEIKQNEIGSFQHPEYNVFSEKDTKELMEYLNSGNTIHEHNQSLAIKQEITDTSDEVRNEVQHSSVESLRQLSNQMAQMMEPNYEFSATGSITDLEKRNLELAAQLEKEKINSEQLKTLNKEYEARIAQLELEGREKELDSSFQAAHDLGRLKEELQTHIQTVGMLVAEKTELAANLSQYEVASKQKTAECEELQARLKASRSRVAELEREINHLKLENSKSQNIEEEYNVTLLKLRADYVSIKEQKEELAQDLLEVREKLKNSSETNLNLQQQNQELSSKLSLAEIKIQQLTNGQGNQIDSQIEQFTEEKFKFEKQVSNLNQMLKTITKERDESSLQYQQYAQQLNGQLANLSNKLEQVQQENENLIIQDQSRIKHIGELERQLQNLQNDQVSFVTRNMTDNDLKNEIESSNELCVQLQIEKTTLEENFTKVSNEKELMMKELEAKNDSISQLESLVEQLRGNQPDSVKLLATMESDKVAAARAVQQNKELKQQMESMQEVFMKLNNDKVELTDKLVLEQYSNRELIEKLQKTELHLQTLADAIEIKDRELSSIRNNSNELNKQVLQQEQLTDRLRHYEAQENCSHAIQNELQEAKQMIVKLTNEVNQSKTRENNEIPSELQEKFHNLKIEKENVESSALKDSNQEETDGSNKNVLDKDNAMKHLEEKVKKTMQEIADLTEEKQRLEHIVLQLQGETETIGEYVALYQHQRMVLKQKAQEKDQQLRQLANDREQVKIKLDKLNELIRKLVTENGVVPDELLRHQESMNNHSGKFCEEHSKLNEEINSRMAETKLTENGEDKHTETAEEIIALLSEIKTSNLVQPNENFHHCPWCSGQLITV